MIDITNVGVGVGIGFSVSVNTEYGDVSYGVATYVAVGYHFDGGGWYVMGSGTYGGVSVSGAYYFDSGYYNVGIGYGYNGVGMNVSYSNYGGWNAGVGVYGVGANYNFNSGRWWASVDVDDLYYYNIQQYFESDEGRPLTADEKQKLSPYHTQTDLNSARIIDGKVPWWLPRWFIGITLGDNIFFQDNIFNPNTKEGIALLGHEVLHVSQFRQGMNLAKYIWSCRNGYFI